MKLRIVNIVDRGVPNKERVHLAVSAPADLSFYLIFDTVLLPGDKISSRPRHTYWFTSQKVSPGDNVVVYTGSGTNITRTRDDGGNNHFFYWGLKETIWAAEASRAVLLEVLSWETSPS